MPKKDKEKKVAIIILGMNNKSLVKNCLESLKKYTTNKNYKTIFSDNGSTDGTIEMIKKDFKWVDLIENGKNLGFNGANNIGVKYAIEKYNSDYFFLLNNDTIILHKNWLENLVEVGEKIPSSGVVGCRLIYPDGSLQHYAIEEKIYDFAQGEKKYLIEDEKKKENKIQKVKHMIGAAFLIKRKLIDKIGLFDPLFFPIYGEEIDYCERARKNGYKIIYTPKTTIIHLRGQTTNPKKIIDHWGISKKNSIILELMNYSFIEIIYWQFVHFGAVFLSKEFGKIKFRKEFLKRFYVLIKAYSKAFKHLPEIIHKRKNRDEKIW